MFSGSATMASSQSFSMIQRRILLSPWPASPVKSDEPLCTSATRLPSFVPCFIFESIFTQEQHLAVARSRDQRVLRVAAVLDHEAGILDAVLAAHALEIAFPALAVRRIREHEIELARRKRIVRQGRVFRATDDVVGGVA